MKHLTLILTDVPFDEAFAAVDPDAPGVISEASFAKEGVENAELMEIFASELAADIVRRTRPPYVV